MILDWRDQFNLPASVGTPKEVESFHGGGIVNCDSILRYLKFECVNASRDVQIMDDGVSFEINRHSLE